MIGKVFGDNFVLSLSIHLFFRLSMLSSKSIRGMLLIPPPSRDKEELRNLFIADLDPSGSLSSCIQRIPNIIITSTGIFPLRQEKVIDQLRLVLKEVTAVVPRVVHGDLFKNCLGTELPITYYFVLKRKDILLSCDSMTVGNRKLGQIKLSNSLSKTPNFTFNQCCNKCNIFQTIFYFNACTLFPKCLCTSCLLTLVSNRYLDYLFA